MFHNWFGRVGIFAGGWFVRVFPVWKPVFAEGFVVMSFSFKVLFFLLFWTSW